MIKKDFRPLGQDLMLAKVSLLLRYEERLK
jgi:hypothetical protein